MDFARRRNVGGMGVHRSVLFGAVLVMVFAKSVQQEGVNETRLPRAAAGSGKQTYMHYCAACHGADARGNGPAAVVLTTSPPDLTTLAKRRGGKFPYDYVFDVLRFGTRFASHGSSEMPIWGTDLRFRGEL
jgi:mono/diheme cytochrome c family protein